MPASHVSISEGSLSLSPTTASQDYDPHRRLTSGCRSGRERKAHTDFLSVYPTRDREMLFSPFCFFIMDPPFNTRCSFQAAGKSFKISKGRMESSRLQWTTPQAGVSECSCIIASRERERDTANMSHAHKRSRFSSLPSRDSAVGPCPVFSLLTFELETDVNTEQDCLLC